MSRIWCGLVGRSEDCDLVLDHSSISRVHAELSCSSSGALFLVDCTSRHGSWVSRGGGWQRVEQDFVQPEELLRLGDHEITAAALLRAIQAAQGTGRGDGEEEDDSGLPRGPVVRNPSTGEVESVTGTER